MDTIISFLLSIRKKFILLFDEYIGMKISISSSFFIVTNTIPFRIPCAISAKVLFAFIGLTATSISTHITDNLSTSSSFIACARSSMSPWFAFTLSTIIFM